MAARLEIKVLLVIRYADPVRTCIKIAYRRGYDLIPIIQKNEISTPALKGDIIGLSGSLQPLKDV